MTAGTETVTTMMGTGTEAAGWTVAAAWTAQGMEVMPDPTGPYCFSATHSPYCTFKDYCNYLSFPQTLMQGFKTFIPFFWPTLNPVQWVFLFSSFCCPYLVMSTLKKRKRKEKGEDLRQC